MPVYEFYCPDRHTISNFFSRRINTEKRPDYSRCRRPELQRQVSMFAISKGRKDSEADDIPNIDDSRMERAMMRKLYDTTGMGLGSGMEERLRRMETGEDPEQTEAEMGDL